MKLHPPEENQHAAVLQLLVHLLQRRFGGSAVDIIDRNKQRAQRFKVGQHAVGDHFDVAAHAGHRVEQGRRQAYRWGGWR